MLNQIYQTLTDFITNLNQQNIASVTPQIHFVKAGPTSYQLKQAKQSHRPSLLHNADDWKLLVDLPDQSIVPMYSHQKFMGLLKDLTLLYGL